VHLKIYVDNLASDLNQEDLRDEFAKYGQVSSVNITSQKYSGRKFGGFAFIEMPSRVSGEAAITGLNGKPFRKLILRVSRVRDLSEKAGGEPVIKSPFKIRTDRWKKL
jgi:RNA recognition motif-containing protein